MIKDGGPVFPRQGYPIHHGMSLRDWFAGMAMQSLVKPANNLGVTELAQLAYGFADAMLKAREVKP